MKKTILFYTLLFSLNSFCFEWYEDWPSSLTADTQYYRGQRTDLASFSHLIDMLINPATDKVITSRMYRTFQKKFPHLSTPELIDLANKQYKYWEQERMLGWIADCHADPYMCSLPKVEKLMGVVFKEEDLPSPILKKHKQEKDPGFINDEPISNGELLEFFDPIVSTSYRQDIANSFGRDRDGFDGYVLILNDKFHRNCSEKRKQTANCFINNEEFMEELEFPMWGFVTSDELDGFIVNSLTIKKYDKNKISIESDEGRTRKILELGDASSCLLIRDINSEQPKLERLKLVLSTYFHCDK